MDSGTIDWAVIGVGIALAGLILATTRSLRAEMRAQAERLSRLEQSQAQLLERLGRLEQEQARMNGVLETIREGLSYRVERGDRVAESSESYEPQG